LKYENVTGSRFSVATYFRYEIIITGNGKEGLSKYDVKEKEKCREKSMK